jgi:hypothetical protein
MTGEIRRTIGGNGTVIYDMTTLWKATVLAEVAAVGTVKINTAEWQIVRDILK